MNFNSPPVIESIKDVKAIFDMNDEINPVQDAERLELDLFVGTATINGIARREKIYGIFPNDTDSLENRRRRLLEKENDRIPYTIRTLRNKLSVLCGKDGYKIFLEEERLTVQLTLAKKYMLDDVCRLLENIVPLNIVFYVGLLYNQYLGFEQFTYEEMGRFTYAQLKEEAIL